MNEVKELKNERKKCSFNTNDMALLLYGQEKMTTNAKIAKLLSNDPIFNKKDLIFKDRKTQFVRALQRTKRKVELTKQMNLTTDQVFQLMDQSDADMGLVTHLLLFVPTIENQCSEKQKKKWLLPAKNCQIIGSYAQTELGHGSNVRGIETTATYDHKTKEFIINSPTLTSTKWWIGGLGKTSNVCALFAQLVIDGKNYGVHSFFVQLRSLTDHTLLPGVEFIGDVGPKFGFNSMDNGCLRFNNLRIPRGNMLARFVKVDKHGKFKTKSNVSSKINYGTMVFARVNFVVNAGNTLARACTIAVRYSSVRRQFPSKQDPKREEQVIDYQSQQYRLLPLVAASYAMLFTGARMLDRYNDLMNDIHQDKSVDEKLAQVHATSSGLKSLTTELTSRGIEECRLCCGGHGYSQMSGLPSLYATYVHKSTAEGDNWMLTQQVARYLFKCIDNPVGASTEYLVKYKGGANFDEKCKATSVEDFLQPRVQIEAYQHRAARLIHETAKREKTEQVLIEIAQVSRAHSLLTIVQDFIDSVQQVSNKSLQKVLKQLCDLFALHHIEEGAIQFVEDGYMTSSQLQLVRKGVRSLLVQVRQEAVGLVDAFQFSDYQLNSALGRYDGKAYEALFDWVKQEPLNETDVPEGYEQYLKPLFTLSKL